MVYCEIHRHLTNDLYLPLHRPTRPQVSDQVASDRLGPCLDARSTFRAAWAEQRAT